MLKNLIKKYLPQSVLGRLAKLRMLAQKKYHLGMTSRYEQEYFEHYVRKIFSGKGQIVDLGSWLGSTTIPLAMGLSKRSREMKKSNKVHAYDQFIWESWMDDFANGCYHKWNVGESFLPEFQQRTKKWDGLIEIHPGDLRAIGWAGGKIEFLLIDAMKSWALANSILKDFFSCLIPGCSYIVHQDFKHYNCYWIHLLAYRFKDNFSMIYDIPQSGSIVMKYTKPIEKELLQVDYSLQTFTQQEIEDAFNYALELVSKDMRPSIIGAKAMCYIDLNDIQKAKREIQLLLDQGFSPASSYDITCVMQKLQ